MYIYIYIYLRVYICMLHVHIYIHIYSRPVNNAGHRTFFWQLINEIAKCQAWVQLHQSKLFGTAATY